MIEKLKKNKKPLILVSLFFIGASVTLLTTKHFYFSSNSNQKNIKYLFKDQSALNACFLSYVLLAETIREYYIYCDEVNKRLNSVKNRGFYIQKLDDLSELKSFRLNTLCSIQIKFNTIAESLKDWIEDYDEEDDDKLNCKKAISTANDYSILCEESMVALSNNHDSLSFYKAVAHAENSFKNFRNSAKYFFSVNNCFLRSQDRLQIIAYFESMFKKEIDKYSAGLTMYSSEIILAEMYFKLKGIPLKNYPNT